MTLEIRDAEGQRVGDGRALSGVRARSARARSPELIAVNIRAPSSPREALSCIMRDVEPGERPRRPAGMSDTVRRAAPVTCRMGVLLVLAVVVAACAGLVPNGSLAPTSGPSNPASATPAPTTGGFGRIEHATGATDVILRFEQGGGFVPAEFLVTLAPIFTLYGDGTVIFRNPATESPPAVGTVGRFAPFRTARLSEDQVQATLEMAIGVGGLGTARPNYDNDHVADASTATFTLDAGGLQKTVSVYALGIDVPGGPDTLPRAAFGRLATRLSDFDQGGTMATQVWVPDRYRGVLTEGQPGGPGARPWPWSGIAPAEFVTPGDASGPNFPTRVLTVHDVKALGIDGYEGGLQGAVLTGPDAKTYSFSLRPLLPDDKT